MRTEVSYFNKRSTSYRKEYDRETPEGYSFRVRREKVLALSPERCDVIDIASGPGVMIPGLLKKHCRITCVDAAPEMIARTKEEYADTLNVEAIVADAYALPFPDARFDTALSMGLIEYLEDQGTFLDEAARILKPGGIFIVTFPNYTSPWRAFNRFALYLKSFVRPARAIDEDNVTHREYHRNEAIALLAKHGLETRKVVYYNFKLIPYPLDRWLPRLTVLQSTLCEYLAHTPLRFFGTGFIVEALRRA